MTMSIDQDLEDEYFNQLVDRYMGYELIERLEDAGLITVWDVIARFEEELLEMRTKLECHT